MGKTKRGTSNLGRAAKDLELNVKQLDELIKAGLMPSQAYDKSYTGKKLRFKTKVLKDLIPEIKASYAIFCANQPKKTRKVSRTKKKIIDETFNLSLFSQPSHVESKVSEQTTPTTFNTEATLRDILHLLKTVVANQAANQIANQARLEAFISLSIDMWKVRHSDDTTEKARQLIEVIKDFEESLQPAH